jgi:hypothetical protein
MDSATRKPTSGSAHRLFIDNDSETSGVDRLQLYWAGRKLSGKSSCGPRSVLAAGSSNCRLGRPCTQRFSAPSIPTLTSRTSRPTRSTRLQSPAAMGFASSTAPLCPRLPMVPSIRSATAMRSRRGRVPLPTGSRGERWRRSTGPIWARSVARRSWRRFGWRSPAATSRWSKQVRAPKTPFAVRVQVRPPRGRHPVWGGLVKGIFDGLICALQAHTDAAVLA